MINIDLLLFDVQLYNMRVRLFPLKIWAQKNNYSYHVQLTIVTDNLDWNSGIGYTIELESGNFVSSSTYILQDIYK